MIRMNSPIHKVKPMIMFQQKMTVQSLPIFKQHPGSNKALLELYSTKFKQPKHQLFSMPKIAPKVQPLMKKKSFAQNSVKLEEIGLKTLQQELCQDSLDTQRMDQNFMLIDLNKLDDM